MLSMNIYTNEPIPRWHIPIGCTCECGTVVDTMYIYKHRQTKKHRNLMEKSDKTKIQERHEALPQMVKKSNAFYVKYPTPTPTNNQ